MPLHSDSNNLARALITEKKQAWNVRYYNQEELTGIELQNNLAADNRSYCDDQDIDTISDDIIYTINDII